MPDIRLITLDPGHFHAALVQKEMYPGINRKVYVFAPLGADLVEHVARIVRFNARPDNPTRWEEMVHAAPDYLDRLLWHPPGDVVVLSGRNRVKIDYTSKCEAAGLHVLADKPCIIRSEDLPRLAATLEQAEGTERVVYDIMTERYEVTSMLQREMVNDPEVFGELVPGSVDEPCVLMESVHHLTKLVAGVPLRRPPWYFDIDEQGEGLSDVGTHLVDLVQWTLFPDQAIDYKTDIELLSGERWPTVISEAEFEKVTGERTFPEYLAENVHGGKLDYYCNNRVSYSIRGVHVKLEPLWDFEAPRGAGDTHFAVYRGTKSRIEIRQGEAENYRPELFVVPGEGVKLDLMEAAVAERLKELGESYAGTSVERRKGELQLVIPDRLRVGHEAHFAQVAAKFFRFIRGEEEMPAWEKPNMLAKYYVTTGGVDLSHGRKPTV